MKVLAFVILVIGSSSGLGSGPYLPSGWKPSGPAFYLPTETEKPAVKVEAVVLETESSGSSFLKEYGAPKVEAEVESSGSDSLREYGPPAPIKVELEVSQDITQQALPVEVTEQAFVKANLVEDEVATVAEEVAQITLVEELETATKFEETIEEETATEAELIEGKEIEIETEIQTEGTLVAQTEVIQDNAEVKNEVQEVTQETDSNTVAVVQKIEEVAGEAQAVETGVKNIAEALVTLENEVKAQQIQLIQEDAELRTVQETTGSLQVPEGFLEYGPPGFAEYGPPKGNLKIEVGVESNRVPSLDSNETRRRRFSPKFKTPKRKH